MTIYVINPDYTLKTLYGFVPYQSRTLLALGYTRHMNCHMLGISWIYAKHIPFELSYDGYISGIYPNYFMYIQHVFKSSNTDGPFS